MNNQEHRYLHTVRQTAALMNIGRTTLYELIKAGRLKVTTVGQRGIRISDDEIRRFIENSSRGS